MKLHVLSWLLLAGSPALLHGGAPVTQIADLLEPHVVLTDIAVTAPETIGYSMAGGGLISFSGELQDNSANIVLRPTEGLWDISAYAYFRVDITNSGEGLVWIRGGLDNISSMAFILPGEALFAWI